ncbi:MAG TPA: hypothetical protein VK611_21570 [Acidimicrobiales bacterium]|nr:hypothetical protein [Acidimicrobiales bacterium]
MSSVTVVNQGEEAFLDLITNIDMTLRLYVNNVTSGLTATQIEALTQAAFTEATFAGYAAVSMTTAWTTTAGDPSEAVRSPVTFTRSTTGVVQQVYGYYLTRNSDGALQWFEHFDAPIPVEVSSDAVTVTPRLTLDDDTGRNRVDMDIFTSSGTWTKPVGLKAILVELVGGGGSGGGTGATAAGQQAEGAGGGAGGYSRKMIQADNLAATVAVTIGAGAVAAAAGAAGATGGTTSFGSHCSATGGAGGTQMGGVAVGANAAAAGGAGGAGASGDLNIPGSAGGTGIVNDGLAARSGQGADSMLSGAAKTIGAGNGTAGKNYGGGSSGALSGASTAARVSTVGAPGVVIITEYF